MQFPRNTISNEHPAMLEIVIPAIIFLVTIKGMAYGKKRKRGFIRVLPFTQTIVADNLAASTLVSGTFTQTVVDDMYLVSVDIICSYRAGAAPSGPVMVGLAHSDYSDAEIEAWVELTDSWDTSNLTEQEIRRRKIRRIGTFAGASVSETLNDGKPIRVPLRFRVEESKTLKFWVFNQSGAALNADFECPISGQVYAKKA